MLKGERITLRAVKREDLPRQAAWENTLETTLLADDNPPRPRSLEQLEAEFDKRIKEDPKPTDDVWFAMEADGVHIGGCGLWGMDLTHRTCWLGISIGEAERRGQGLGREAIQLLAEYAFRYLNMRKICLTTGGDNERAQRCYRACGFVEEGRLREQEWCNGRYIDAVYMGLFREEWSRRNE